MFKGKRKGKKKKFAMSDSIPKIRGPKLFPFNGDLANAQFIKPLNIGDENASSGGAHSRVFQVRIEETIFSVKIFKFISIKELRPMFFGYNTQPISDNVIRHQLDPFFAECRAFGRLTEKKRDQDLAVRCYGYAYLDESVERRIKEELGIHDWNRSSEHTNEPLRAIVKDYIRYHSFYKPSKFALMRSRLQQLNELGIYNMDIRKESYLGGRLFDFSTAITTPHISFSLDVRTQAQIMRDIRYDLVCLDAMEKAESQQQEQIKKTRWGNIGSRKIRDRDARNSHVSLTLVSTVSDAKMDAGLGKKKNEKGRKKARTNIPPGIP